VRTEALDRNEQRQGAKDEVHRHHLDLGAPQVGRAGTEHQEHDAGCGDRGESRRDVQRRRQDQADRRQQLERADALDLALVEVLRLRLARGRQLLLGPA
jgi:hypothetical protein